MRRKSRRLSLSGIRTYDPDAIPWIAVGEGPGEDLRAVAEGHVEPIAETSRVVDDAVPHQAGAGLRCGSPGETVLRWTRHSCPHPPSFVAPIGTGLSIRVARHCRDTGYRPAW